LLITAAVGGEIYLLGYQLVYQKFCPYCLIYAVVVIILFLLHRRDLNPRYIVGLIAGGLTLFVLGFSGQLFPVYAAIEESAPALPSYGNGPLEIRLYTDYFCQPCQALEEQIEPLFAPLVQSGQVKLIFVDTPIHPRTGLYAQYFLFALADGENTLERSVKLRNILFNAARHQIEDEAQLVAFLKKQQVNVRKGDIDRLLPVLRQYSSMINNDRIGSTPQLVAYREGNKEKITGAKEILKYFKEKH